MEDTSKDDQHKTEAASGGGSMAATTVQGFPDGPPDLFGSTPSAYPFNRESPQPAHRHVPRQKGEGTATPYG